MNKQTAQTNKHHKQVNTQRKKKRMNKMAPSRPTLNRYAFVSKRSGPPSQLPALSERGQPALFKCARRTSCQSERSRTRLRWPAGTADAAAQRRRGVPVRTCMDYQRFLPDGDHAGALTQLLHARSNTASELPTTCSLFSWTRRWSRAEAVSRSSRQSETTCKFEVVPVKTSFRRGHNWKV